MVGRSGFALERFASRRHRSHAAQLWSLGRYARAEKHDSWSFKSGGDYFHADGIVVGLNVSRRALGLSQFLLGCRLLFFPICHAGIRRDTFGFI